MRKSLLWMLIASAALFAQDRRSFDTWKQYGGSADSSQYSSLRQINSTVFCSSSYRETGRPLWPIEERRVPQSDVPGEEASPTQPFPTLPPPFARQSMTEKDINPFLPEPEREALVFALPR
jgi:glucose dehydrogenase